MIKPVAARLAAVPPGLLGLLVLGLTLVGEWAGAAVLLIATVAALSLARSRQGKSDRVFASRLFLVAVLVRSLLVAGIWVVLPHLGVDPSQWFPDGYLFDVTARKMALNFNGLPVTVDYRYDHYYVSIYSILAARGYQLLGYQPLLPLCVNAVLGATTPVVVLAAARRVATPSVTRLSAVIVAFIPSVVLWSAFNLRDTSIAFAIAVSIWLVTMLMSRPAVVLAIGATCILVLLARLRWYIGIPALWLAGSVSVLSLTRRTPAALTAVPLFVLLLVFAPWLDGGGPAGLRWVQLMGVETEFPPTYGTTVATDPLAPQALLDRLHLAFAPPPHPTPDAQSSAVALAGESAPSAAVTDPSQLGPPAAATAAVPTAAAQADAPGPVTRETQRTLAGLTSSSTQRATSPESALASTDIPAPTPPPAQPTPPPEENKPQPAPVATVPPIGSPQTAPTPAPGLDEVLQVRSNLASEYTDGGNRTAFVSESEGDISCRSASCLPSVLLVGATHLLFAPFPWQMRTMLDFAVLPEMAFWYALILLTVPGLVLRWRAWREWIFPALLLGEMIGVLSLIETNVGIVVRHRAMLLPALAILGAQGAQGLLDLYASRRHSAR